MISLGQGVVVVVAVGGVAVVEEQWQQGRGDGACKYTKKTKNEEGNKMEGT